MGREAMIRADMEAVGTYSPIFDRTIKDCAKRERELAKAEKAWRSAYCIDGVQREPQMVATLINKQGLPYQAKDPYYAEVSRLRKEVESLRAQLGLTPKSLRRLIGVAGSDTPQQQDMITAKLDQIAARVAGYDNAADIPEYPFADLPGAAEAAAFREQIDEDLRKAIAEDMG